MPPHVYVTVWEDLHNTIQMFTQKKKKEGITLILAVVLLLPLLSCRGDTVCFGVKAKLLCLAFQKTT